MNITATFTRFSTAAALILIAASVPAFAHDGHHPEAPNPSPNAGVSQEIGYGNVTVKFGRPGVKGRTVWGELVAYDGGQLGVWMAGANGSTIITFDEDVKINGNKLKAGSYGFFVVPGKDEWTLVFSNNSSKFGIMKYTKEEDALRITVKPEAAAHQEWLDYKIVKTGELTATISLHWAKLKAGFTVEAKDNREEE